MNLKFWRIGDRSLEKVMVIGDRSWSEFEFFGGWVILRFLMVE